MAVLFEAGRSHAEWKVDVVYNLTILADIHELMTNTIDQCRIMMRKFLEI